ncbi:MAG: hypothetical protein A3A43_01795 [Candidatus Liptonbacteria bacterium RIFCSPLOWO2_01_FULL_56_20]|uniref:EamA domain-containing protein n=1 Tax=Candidatus Liptonbacteria bacterium RIFCSPLOWO2_01_FULL_56_20 TaxID=1798652 RepID=A0A1G2CJI9_9BACT|nr:MAG: hypothetical protein A2681_01870 [Candidatus Liptonbacteria bacterium RIFCSPHIGHO2_01_FULL_56_18b]OGZ00900.1 MAG: hypothetical protein A3A43_01795 [Candidatus Liptonbacteria bacterium RIFCSPLOWO2_01_FULL_56_20]
MITTFGLTLALAAAILFTTYGLVSRVLAKSSSDPLAFSVLYGVWSSLIATLLFLFEPWRFGDITLGVLFITFLATVLFAIFQGTEFFSRKYLEASRLTVLFQITPVITFVASVFFLREGVSLEKIIAITLIALGNIIAVYKHGGYITPRGLLFGLITVCSLGLAYVADKAVFEYYPIGLYIIITYLVPSFYASFLLGGEWGTRLKNETRATSWKIPLLGAISVLGYYLMLSTFRVAEASVAIPIIYISTILTAFGGVVILKETTNIPQKLLGAVFVFLGVILLK